MTRPSVAVADFLFRKRSRKALRLRHRVTRRYQQYLNNQRLSNLAFGRESKIIAMLARRANSTMPASRYSIAVPVGKKFSIIDEPKATIELICSFARALQRGKRISHIKFHHEHLQEYELAANAILDLVTVERKAELKSRGSTTKMNVSGYYPADLNVRRFIKAMGIIKHMGVKHEAPPKEETDKLRFFDSRNRNYRLNPDARAADFKDVQQRKFVDFIDECLRRCDKRGLSDLGKFSLIKYTGEILANAEDHAEFIDWSIQGYLDTGAEVPTCEIAIFNFGKSIAETLNVLDKGSLAWRRLQPYVDRHMKNGFFDTKWRLEDLLTVVALQQHISSKNTEEDDSRGQGTVYFIDFFQQMHDECAAQSPLNKATMSIVSGSTYILFDGKYRLAARPDGNKVIAFNATNDLEEKPDPKYVRALEGVHFPGTIISVRFPLSLGKSPMVEEIQDETNED